MTNDALNKLNKSQLNSQCLLNWSTKEKKETNMYMNFSQKANKIKADKQQ